MSAAPFVAPGRPVADAGDRGQGAWAPHPLPAGDAARGVVLLDKDGTLVVDVPYNVDPARIRLAPGAGEGLSLLACAGWRLAVVSNQSGVARGFFPEAALGAVRARIEALLLPFGVRLAGFRWCPHHPEGAVRPLAVACACRKPAPGMLLEAAADLGADPEASWMIGDILDDVEAGRAAGCRTVLIDNGNETEWRLSRARLPHALAPDMLAAARIVLAAGSASRRAAA